MAKRFAYKALASDGAAVQGEMDAPDAATVIDNLQASDFLPISTDELVESHYANDFRLWSRRRVTRHDVHNFTRELATMLSAGLPLSHALETLTSLTDRPATADLFERIRANVEAGNSLSASLEQSGGPFSQFYVSLIRAGEASGALELVLVRIAEYQSRSQQLRDAVFAALLYPAILLFVAGSSLIVLLTYVVPQFEPLFEDLGQSLPLSTQIVVALATVLREFWWAIPLVGGALWVGFRRLLAEANFRRRWDAFVLRLPVLGDLIVRIEVTRMCRTLGTLTSSGVTLLDAVNIVRESATNRVFAEALEAIAEDLARGRGLSRPMSDAQVFPQLVIQLVRVGEETGGLAPMLLKLSDIYDEETQSAIKRLLALLEPALILGLGLLIAFIIVSILLAILGLNELVA
ncbi:MAG: type II secretion system F family protein [Gammaproteobacteria bacterium]|jgi:general secretion pathway protein F